MSRLRTNSQQARTKRALLIMGASIVLVIALATMGFRFIINGAVLIGSLGKGEADQTSKNTSPTPIIGSIRLDPPPAATNEAQLDISGLVSGFDTVEIRVNDVRSGNPRIEDEGLFSYRITDLTEGEHEILAIARKKGATDKKESRRYTVMVKKSELLFEISNPGQDTTVRTQDLIVSGTVEPETTVRVNNAPLVVSVEGVFSGSVRLQEGENLLRFEAQDIAGNTKIEERRVRYERDS